MTVSVSASRAVVLMMLAAGAWGCGHDTPEEVESEAVVPVETSPARVGDITAAVRVTGLVTPAPGAELIVVAPEAARIAELPRAEGDRVAAGDLLVRFDIPNAGADVARQRGEIARAQAQIANARAAQTRARDLFERGIAARKEMEDADRDLADADALLAEATGALTAAESVAARATVRAPFAGVIARRAHNVGDVVEASAADPVLRLIDPRRVEVVAQVSAGDAPRVNLGAHARLVGADGATLSVVSRPLAVDAATGAAPVRLAFTGPPAGLAFGTPVQVEIQTGTHSGVVLVPAAAVVYEGEEAAVFVADGDKAARRVVTLGATSGSDVEIVSGVAAGDAVIVRGQAGLPDGAAISTGSAKP